MAELRKSSSRRKSSKTQPMLTHSVKCVVMGDGDVGKSSMLLTHLIGRFPLECPPGPMDGHAEFDHVTSQPVTFVQENVEVKMTLVDTYGQDEYEKLREKVCCSADVFILCFDVSRPETFERIRYQWLPEIRKYSPADTPFVIVGLKTDLRSKAMAEGSDVTKFISYGDGLKAATELGTSFYLECSAKSNGGAIKRILEKAAQAALQNSLPENMKRSSCVVS